MQQLSNAEIADRTGMSQSAISLLRSGKRIPTLPTMRAITQAMELPDEAVATWLKSIYDEGAEGSATFLRSYFG